MVVPEQETKSTNKVNPGVKVLLDKERTLKLDLNAMEVFEKETGVSLLGGKFKWTQSIKNIKNLLWACLLHEDETLLKKDVGSWVYPNNMEEVLSKLNEAFEVAMPESEDTETVPLVQKPRSG